MFQGLVKAALPMVAAAAFMALTATSSPAFTLSAPSLDKPTAASNIEQVNRVRHRGGGGWHRPWVYGYGVGIARGSRGTARGRPLSDRAQVRSISRPP